MYKTKLNCYPATSVSLLQVAKALDRIANELHTANELQLGFLRTTSEEVAKDVVARYEEWKGETHE